MSLSEITKETRLEKATDNLLTSLIGTSFAVIDGGILSAFLPILISTLAAERHKERTQNALSYINSMLKEHSDKLETLTDNQYKLIADVTVSVLTTTEDEKINYLKKVIKGAISNQEIISLESEIIGRWLRNISADELTFILNNFQYPRIEISNAQTSTEYKTVTEDSKDATIISGLISLGILLPSGPNLDTLGTYNFSNLTVKLIALIKS